MRCGKASDGSETHAAFPDRQQHSVRKFDKQFVIHPSQLCDNGGSTPAVQLAWRLRELSYASSHVAKSTIIYTVHKAETFINEIYKQCV
jgi:hypothetical protein